MSTLDEISTAFAAADTFEPVVGAPTNVNVERIWCAVVKLIHIFHYHEKHDSLSGLTKPEAKYTSRFGHVFDRLGDIITNDYNPNMPSDPNNQDMRKKEGILKAQKSRAILVAISDAEAHRFILAVMEETWVIYIEDLDTYYNEVTARQLLDHLAKNCNGLNNTDVVDIYLTMPKW